MKEGVLSVGMLVAKVGRGAGRTGITSATRTRVGIRCEWMFTTRK